MSHEIVLLVALQSHSPSIMPVDPNVKCCWEHHTHIHHEAQIQIKHLNELDVIRGINVDVYWHKQSEPKGKEDVIISESLNWFISAPMGGLSI